MDRVSYKRTAREQLQGNWGALVLMCFIYGLFFGGSNYVNTEFGAGNNFAQNIIMGLSAEEFFLLVLGGIAFSLVFMVVVYPLLHGALTVGQSKYLINFVERGEKDLNTLFSEFNNFMSKYKLSFMYNLYLLLWGFVPFVGIVKFYSYSLTFYIKAVHPEYSSNECITKSRQYMNGYKWDLFVLQLSFLGWSILCVLTLGIGLLWLVPYMEVTKANIYRDMLVANGEIILPEKVENDIDNIGDGLDGIN